MKIVLYDQINETHVCVSLAQALTALGHEVVTTGKVWSGHRFAEREADLAVADERVDELLSLKPDALFNFRASSLLPEQVTRLRQAGVATMVWFPDDPVLYALCYSAVVDHYDFPLHCAGRRVLDFYRFRKHRAGINFPFWIDPQALAYNHDATACDHDLVFFGNMHGPAKKKRYELFCSLHDDLTIYGRVPNDPNQRARPPFEDVMAAADTLRSFKIGLNSAQTFSDYAGSAYDFPGLGMLGEFFLPSRVLQYAAIGLPTLTLPASPEGLRHHPAGLFAGSAAQVRALLQRVLPDAGYRQVLSLAARRDVERWHSAGQRARLLVALLDGRLKPAELTAHEQEFAYQFF